MLLKSNKELRMNSYKSTLKSNNEFDPGIVLPNY